HKRAYPTAATEPRPSVVRYRILVRQPIHTSTAPSRHHQIVNHLPSSRIGIAIVTNVSANPAKTSRATEACSPSTLGSSRTTHRYTAANARTVSVSVQRYSA